MTIEDLLAREGIRGTLARYTDAGDNGRYDVLIECYATDGVFEIASGKWTGREAIRAALIAMRTARTEDGVTLQRHHLATCDITIDGPDSARSVTYFSVISEIGLDHTGRYIDVHVRHDGHWQFAHRNVTVEWRDPASRFVPRS